MGPLAVQILALVIRHALLIVNPASRRGARDVHRTEAALSACGVTCDRRLTDGPGAAAALARAHGLHADAVFALGGDGTVVEAMSGLMGTGVPLGALPAGTGNLLARALGIPLDPARAARALCAGHVRTMDLAALGSGGHFAVAAGIGIDARMVEHARASLKRRLGVAGYVLIGTMATLSALWRDERFQARIWVDGAEFDCDALTVLVANVGTVLSGTITLAPGARFDDGALDVAVYAPRTLAQALRVAWRMLRGRFPNDDLTRFYRGTHIRVSTVPIRRAQADGELLSAGDFEARLLPAAGRVLIPGIG